MSRPRPRTRSRRLTSRSSLILGPSQTRFPKSLSLSSRALSGRCSSLYSRRGLPSYPLRWMLTAMVM
eukprot:7959310-Pyramimonas_sp.AAC.1